MVHNIQHLIQQGEGLIIEFKRAKDQLPSNLFETVCAFLNRAGGNILLGVNDDKTIEGVNPGKAETICKDFVNLSNNPQKLFPTFLLDATILEYNGKKIIHILVPISSQVHKCNNRIFDRTDDGDFELNTSEQIKNLYLRKSSLYSENTIYPYLKVADFEKGVVERVRKLIRIQRPEHPWNELTDQEFFKTAGLWRKDFASNLEGFTMSALLLFGKPETIGSALPHYKIDALVRVRDLERYDDRENIRCNLVEAYDLLMKFVAKHLPDKFYLEGDHRISLRDTIFREIMANLLIHREYTNAYPSTFVIYKDSLEVKNANKPHSYGQLLPSAFEPFPKNPHIAQIFTQIGRSEELGTGIRKVYKYAKAYAGDDNIEFLEQDVFITKVPLDKLFFKTGRESGGISGGISDGINGGINVTSKEDLFIFLTRNPGLNTKTIKQKTEIAQRTIERWIKELKEDGKIGFLGPKKTGGYHIR
ncbi:MAG: RNA-binding domain-containing protein [Lentimicrobium sp.]